MHRVAIQARGPNISSNTAILPNRLSTQESKSLRILKRFSGIQRRLLFTVCVEITADGRPLPLGDRLNRERFGRFPYGNGSALDYLLEFIRPNRSITDNDGQDIYDLIIDDLRTLSAGCTEEFRGHALFESGFGGMNIQGYLSSEQVRTLRKNLASRTWTASYEEPLGWWSGRCR